MDKTLTDADVHAYADRQLAPARVAEFEEAMARDPALAAKVAEIERQNAWLRDGLAPLLDEPLPQRLIDAARGAPRRASPLASHRHWPLRPRSSLGLGVGWYARDAHARARRHADELRPRGGFRACALRVRREATGRSLGARGKAAGRLALQAAGSRRCMRPISTARAMRWSAGGSSPGTRSRRRCSCTRTRPSNG